MTDLTAGRGTQPHNGTSLTQEQPSAALGAMVIARQPELVLAEAQHAARALKNIIDAKPRKVILNGETYLEFEDWQTCGRFYGLAPRITSSRFVEHGPFTGWEASADAVHVETGTVVSSADGMCLTDEPHWRVRPTYEWHYVLKSGGTAARQPSKDELIWEAGRDGTKRPKRQRVLVGEEPVPEFQRRSMAQTRAGAKALRNALAWVVVLAGYRPTPAEELTIEIENGDAATLAQAASGNDVVAAGAEQSQHAATRRVPAKSAATTMQAADNPRSHAELSGTRPASAGDERDPAPATEEAVQLQAAEQAPSAPLTSAPGPVRDPRPIHDIKAEYVELSRRCRKEGIEPAERSGLVRRSELLADIAWMRTALERL